MTLLSSGKDSVGPVEKQGDESVNGLYTLKVEGPALASRTTKVVAIRLLNEIIPVLERDSARNGYPNIGAYLRAKIENETKQNDILISLSDVSLAWFQLRATQKGWDSVRAYIEALLTRFSDPELDIVEQEAESKPALVTKKKKK